MTANRKYAFLVTITALFVLSSSPAVWAQAAPPAQTAPALAITGVPIARADAEALALKNNPGISAGRLLALAQGETVREVRSAELPQLNSAVTAEQAEDGSRIGAGALSSSRLYTHAGAGGSLSQLLTDFGRTRNLVATAKLRAKAQQQNARATEQDILYATDQAFYRLLNAQELLKVAQQTVAARKSVYDQINALTQAQLRSTLDLNISAADLSQAQLLELDARNELQSASAALAALLAAAPDTTYTAIEDASAAPPLPPDNSAPLEALALATRPDLSALRFNFEAAQKFARAQNLQHLPTIDALAIGGITPVRPDGDVFVPNWYAAGGVNFSLPLFTGFRISAETREAQYRARAQQAQAADLANNIQRDVRTATLSAQTAFQRISVTEAFRAQAAQALSLAQTRYNLGLSSIVELSQAQLQSTQADVAAVNARYDYLLALRSLSYTEGQLAP
jgi:outer membrane protein